MRKTLSRDFICVSCGTTINRHCSAKVHYKNGKICGRLKRVPFDNGWKKKKPTEPGYYWVYDPPNIYVAHLIGTVLFSLRNETYIEGPSITHWKKIEDPGFPQ